MPTIRMNHKNYQVKSFPHFDQRIQVTKAVNQNLQNPAYIAAHSFYPFIHYTKVTRKFTKEKILSDPKKREIFYASHMDGYIFKHYGELLNDRYNRVCREKGIDHVALAYRNNKNGRSNIHFAAEVIQFISEQQKAFIFVSDFSSYFDNLDHAILKKRLADVLGVHRLPDDWWNVFKHITRYSWVNKEELAKDLELKKQRKINDRTNRERYFTPAEFREFRKRVDIKQNPKDVGIPQGTAISAVLANVYSIDLDQALNKYASSFGGIYRRYSDDIILVIPMDQDGNDYSANHKSFIETVVQNNKVTMGDDKTSSLYFKDRKVYKDPKFQQEGRLDYLGFTFDGTTVKVREKSLFKYYHRAYKKVASINKASFLKGRKVGRKKLYSLYTHLGRKYKGYGNFISYCERAHQVFDENDNVDSLIYQQIKRHWSKIQKRLL